MPAALTWAERPAARTAARAARARDVESARVARASRVLSLLVLLMPLNWLLGTTAFAALGAAVILALAAAPPSRLEWAFAMLAGTLALSIAAGLASGLHGADVVGAAFNVVVILVLVVILQAARRLREGRPDGANRIYAAARTCFWIQAAIVVLAKVYVGRTGEAQVSFPTALGLAGELPGLLAFYSQFYLSVGDGEWPFTDPRSTGIGIYATEGAILFLVVGLLASLHALRRGRVLRAGLIEVVILAGLVEMASRTTTLAFVASTLCVLALFGRRTLLLAVGAGVLGGTALVLGLAFHPGWLNVASEGAHLNRAASSLTRMSSYRLGIAMTLENSPLIGLGHLPKDETILPIPIGSHSSWVSLFTRGGFTALACWLFINVSLLGTLVRSAAASLRDDLSWAERAELVMLCRCVLVLMLWWITEDFDFPIHEIVLSGICIGLLVGATRNLRRPIPAGWSTARL